MARLNYHHLHYFWAVARHGHLTRAAEHLHISQSALSSQIKQLEGQLGQPLFVREKRRLELTEAGRIALGYAERIFASGEELLATIKHGLRAQRQVLRIGAVATLSRNFQEGFLTPLVERDDVELVLQSGNLQELLARLRAHALDLVLSNHRVEGDARHDWRCQRIARQGISLVGPPRGRGRAFRFPRDLAELRLLLPSRDSAVRIGFDALCEHLDVSVDVLAEVDDMAMLRLLARSSNAAAVVPKVVVRDELRDRRLQEYCTLPDLYENFYAISVKRQYQPPLLKALLNRDEGDVLKPPNAPRTRA